MFVECVAFSPPRGMLCSFPFSGGYPFFTLMNDLFSGLIETKCIGFCAD